MPYPVSIFNSLSAFKFAAKKQQLVLLIPPRPEAPQRDRESLFSILDLLFGIGTAQSEEEE